MRPQDRSAQVAQLAAAVVASAAAGQAVKRPVPYGCDGDPCTIPHHHPVPDEPQRHDGDCQAAQHTYVSPGVPGVYPHGDRHGRHFAADAVGVNGRRLLVRDDPDGVYVGGALFTTEDAYRLAAFILETTVRREGQGRA